MQDILKLESTVTDRYQTTIPGGIRKALNLGKRDKLRYIVKSDGSVLLKRAEVEAEEDPLVGKFLAFIASDIEKHPERLQTVSADLVARARELTATVEVDLEAPLSPDDA